MYLYQSLPWSPSLSPLSKLPGFRLIFHTILLLSSNDLLPSTQYPLNLLLFVTMLDARISKTGLIAKTQGPGTKPHGTDQWG